MNNNTKKIWSPNIDLKEATEISKNFLEKCDNKKLITRSDFSLFQVYKVDKDWPLENLIEVSRFFKFSKNDVPETDRARESIIRLLSAVTKSHLYFEENSLVCNEPYVFSIPNIFKSGQFNYGLIYHIEKNNKKLTLLVAEWNILLSSSHTIKLNPWEKHTAIISNNTTDYFNLEKSKKIKSMDNYGYFEISDWKSRQKYQNIINVNNQEDFKFGKLLDYDIDLKDIYTTISYIEWCKNLKKWFIPKGADYKEIICFIDNIKKQVKKDD